jgi:MFS family permease
MSSAAEGARSPKQRRNEVVAAERRQFGGIKWGSAFFGWLAATGIGVILTALVAAIGTAVGIAESADPAQVAEQASRNLGTVGIAGGIILAVILFISYFCGGYVAGRMARFDGVKQGLAVWLWAIVVAIVLAILGLIAGSQFNVLSSLNSFPRVPLGEGELTIGGIVFLVVAALVSLAGAILGGRSGMHFHRKVDQVGVDRRFDGPGDGE